VSLPIYPSLADSTVDTIVDLVGARREHAR
jgi:hypothetical protein